MTRRWTMKQINALAVSRGFAPFVDAEEGTRVARLGWSGREIDLPEHWIDLRRDGSWSAWRTPSNNPPRSGGTYTGGKGLASLAEHLEGFPGTANRSGGRLEARNRAGGGFPLVQRIADRGHGARTRVIFADGSHVDLIGRVSKRDAIRSATAERFATSGDASRGYAVRSHVHNQNKAGSRNRSGFKPDEARAWAEARQGTTPYNLWKHAVVMTAAMTEPSAATLVDSPEWVSRLKLWWNTGDTVQGAAEMLAQMTRGRRLSARSWDSRETLRAAKAAGNRNRSGSDERLRGAIDKAKARQALFRRAVRAARLYMGSGNLSADVRSELRRRMDDAILALGEGKGEVFGAARANGPIVPVAGKDY